MFITITIHYLYPFSFYDAVTQDVEQNRAKLFTDTTHICALIFDEAATKRPPEYKPTHNIKCSIQTKECKCSTRCVLLRVKCQLIYADNSFSGYIDMYPQVVLCLYKLLGHWALRLNYFGKCSTYTY